MCTAKMGIPSKQNKISRFLKNPFGLFKKKETAPEQKYDPPDPKPHQYDVLQNTVFSKRHIDPIDSAMHSKDDSIKTKELSIVKTNDGATTKEITEDDRPPTETKDGETNEESKERTKEEIVLADGDVAIVKAKEDSRSKNYSESSSDSGFLDDGKETGKEEDDGVLAMERLSIDKHVGKRKPKIVTLSRGPIRNKGHGHSHIPYTSHVNLNTCSGGRVETGSSQEEIPEVYSHATHLPEAQNFKRHDPNLAFLENPITAPNFPSDVNHGDLSNKFLINKTNVNTGFEVSNELQNNYDAFSVYESNGLKETSIDLNGGNHQIENVNRYPIGAQILNTDTAGGEIWYSNGCQNIDELPVANENTYLDTINTISQNLYNPNVNIILSCNEYPFQSNTFNPDDIFDPTNICIDELVNDIINNKQEYHDIAVKLSQDVTALVDEHNSSEFPIHANNLIEDQFNIDQVNAEKTIDLPNIEEFRIDYCEDIHSLTDINKSARKAERYANPSSISSQSSNEGSPILINIDTPPSSVQDSCMFSPKIEATVATTKKLNLPDFKRIQHKLDKELSLACCYGKRDSCKELFQKYFAKLNDTEVMRMRKLVATQSLTAAHGFLVTIILKLHELAEVGIEESDSEIAEHMCKFYLVCLRVLEQDDTFFISNDKGLVILSAACRFCPHSPLLARFLTECAQHQHSKRRLKRDWIFNEVDELGENLPMTLVRSGDDCADVLNEIVRSGGTPLFNIHHVNNEGCMALHIASKLHSVKIPLLRTVHVLLKHGNADLWAQEMKTNETAAHFAVNSNHSDINLVLLLFNYVQNGDRKRLARFKAVSDKSSSPLDYAKQKERSYSDYPKEILEFLKKLR